MPLIQWNRTLSVHVKEIDNQHMKLIQMINALDNAMQAGAGKSRVEEILSEMVNYTEVHFASEEKYFRQFGYPDTLSHTAEHQKFIDEVAKIQKEFNEGVANLPIRILTFLSDWLRNHIMVSDKKFGPFLKEKGLK